MSFIRALSSFILSFFFVTFLFAVVTSYTIGNLIEKENLKSFVKSDIAPKLIAERCEIFCKNETGSCLQDCILESTNQTGEAVDNAIDELYEREILGMSLNSISSFLFQPFLFLLLTLVFGTLLTIASENPLDSLGKSFISTSISLFVAGFSPNLIAGTSISGTPLMTDMFSYLSSGLMLQIQIGIALLVLGIALLIINKFKK